MSLVFEGDMRFLKQLGYASDLILERRNEKCSFVVSSYLNKICQEAVLLLAYIVSRPSVR